jgi:hypothetical protein
VASSNAVFPPTTNFSGENKRSSVSSNAETASSCLSIARPDFARHVSRRSIDSAKLQQFFLSDIKKPAVSGGFLKGRLKPDLT